jgi:hypothetical protein
MATVFSRAAWFAVALMAATAGLGLWIGDLHGVTDPVRLRWGTVHRLSGVFAALVVVLVNSMAVTYFIGTGRWCREVAETYRLDAGLVDRSRRLKRSAFPLALLGMLAVVAQAIASPRANDAVSSRRSWLWNCTSGRRSAAAMHTKAPAARAIAMPITWPW